MEKYENLRRAAGIAEGADELADLLPFQVILFLFSNFQSKKKKKTEKLKKMKFEKIKTEKNNLFIKIKNFQKISKVKFQTNFHNFPISPHFPG